MISGVLDNVLNNAFRYTKDRVRISAGERDGYLFLRIEDNGPGYSESMLVQESDESPRKKTVDFETGSTGLGLYFSILVAKSHTHEDREGYISIVNGGAFGGGVFSFYIP
jgi:signal transduction histidine kinase